MTDDQSQQPRGLSFLERLAALLRGRSANERSLEELFEPFAETAQMMNDDERQMLANLLSFGELHVEDVMVPRADIVAVEAKASLEELVKTFRDAQHARLPIYRQTLDDPIGMVHIKDVIGVVPMPDNPATDESLLLSLRRDVLFVPPSMRAMDLLIKMQKTRIHMALVIDEYGGTDGLATIDDLIVEIVGDIDDEHDIDEIDLVTPVEGGGFIASARISVEELEQAVGRSLALPDKEGDIDTLGGLVFSLVGRVPQRGELIRHPAGLEFEIVDADPRRVKRVRVHVQPVPDDLSAPPKSGRTAA